jgi:hypothetical protein
VPKVELPVTYNRMGPDGDFAISGQLKLADYIESLGTCRHESHIARLTYQIEHTISVG